MKQSSTVAAWLDSYDNPMRDVVRRVRDTILRADARITESIEGNAPTFSYRGTLASIFPESKKHVSLMVERGAQIPGHHPRLEGSGEARRVLKIHDMADAHAAAYDLQHLVRAWCDWRDADAAVSDEPAAGEEEKPAAKKKSAPRKKAAAPAAKTAKAAQTKSGKKESAKPKSGKTKSGKTKSAERKAEPAGKKTAPKKTSARAAKPAAKKGRERTGPRSRGR